MIHICGAETVSLDQKKCIPCQGGIPPLTKDEIKPFMEQIDNNWNLIADHHIEQEKERGVYFTNSDEDYTRYGKF